MSMPMTQLPDSKPLGSSKVDLALKFCFFYTQIVTFISRQKNTHPPKSHFDVLLDNLSMDFAPH